MGAYYDENDTKRVKKGFTTMKMTPKLEKNKKNFFKIFTTTKMTPKG